MAYKNVKYGKKAVRRNYSKIRTEVELPDLLEIQTGQTSNPLPASHASDLPTTNVMSAAERVTKEAGENENGMEKDVEANDMLDLDSFFS